MTSKFLPAEKEDFSGRKDLPDMCYSTLPSTGALIMLTRGENTYQSCTYSKPNPEENRHFADTHNKIHGIGKAQESAMLSASIFGKWDAPAADPNNYDNDGKPLRLPKKNDRER